MTGTLMGGGMRRIWVMSAAAMVSACGGGDAPGGQVVATVNGDEITRGEVNAALPGSAPSDPKEAAALRNAVLDQLVAQRLVVQEAKRQNLDKSQPYLLAMRQGEAQILANLLTRNVLQGIRTPDGAAIDRFIAANPTRFGERVILNTEQIRAPVAGATTASLENAHSLDEIRARLRVDDAQVTRGRVPVDSLKVAPQTMRRLLALPPGEPYIGVDGNVLLASAIMSVEQRPLTGDAARKAALELMKQEAGAAALRRQFEALKKGAEVRYQDGFGPAASASPPAAQK